MLPLMTSLMKIYRNQLMALLKQLEKDSKSNTIKSYQRSQVIVNC